MIERQFIEKLLTANGVDPSAPDEEIKSVLISAKWNRDDVDTAIMVLRENLSTHEQRIASVKHVFHSDERLKPETITSLLGIAMEVPPPEEAVRKRGGISIGTVLVLILVACVFSAVGVAWMMWQLHMRPFVF